MQHPRSGHDAAKSPVTFREMRSQLQLNAGDEPFFLSARQAGELLNIHFVDASKYLFALTSDGVLELVSRGSGNKASRYRYIWKGEAA